MSATTYFPAVQYHRRQELNFCVRDGNRCFLPPVVTDKSSRGLPPAASDVSWIERLDESPRFNESQPIEDSATGSLRDPPRGRGGFTVGGARSA